MLVTTGWWPVRFESEDVIKEGFVEVKEHQLAEYMQGVQGS